MRRLGSIVEKRTVVAREICTGVEYIRKALSRALQLGTPFEDRARSFARKDFPQTLSRQIMLACKRVPNGIVCLKSAVRFHGFSPS